MATQKLPGPSGFPYFSQFCLAVSSVSVVQALVIWMNSVTARGSSGFLSGCFMRLRFLYAFLITFMSEPGSMPRIQKGSNDFSGSILLICTAVRYQTNQSERVMNTLKQNPGLIHVFECTFCLFLMRSWHLVHSQFLLLTSIFFSPKIMVLRMPQVNGTSATVRIEMKKQQNAESSQSRSFSSSRWKLS